MEHSIYAYWRKQSEVLKSILADRARLTAPFVQLYQSVRPDRIYLVGSGTSLNAENAARCWMEELLGVEVTAVPSSRIDLLYGHNPLVMFISQGGSSTNTLEAMEKLKDYPYITLTGEDECEIKRRSKCHGLIGCGRELVGPKTVGYTASVLCFFVNALEAAHQTGSIDEQKYESCLQSLNLAAENMAHNADAAEAWFVNNSEQMAEIHKYVLVGAGAAGIAGAEGALKLQETIKAPCLAFEFEEYLHGPILMTDEKLGGLTGLDHPSDEQAIAQIYARLTGFACPIGFVNDAQVALHAATGGTGVVVIAGTGSIVFGMRADGQTAQVGGWPPCIGGDEGSGSWIAAQALRHLSHVLDGRREPTLLSELLTQRLSVQAGEELIALCIQMEKGTFQNPGISQWVNEAAQAGDEAARELLEAAAQRFFNRNGTNEKHRNALPMVSAGRCGVFWPCTARCPSKIRHCHRYRMMT